ncbi:MAG: hypothetical protein ABIQ18_41920 [Umezawaea sp.]
MTNPLVAKAPEEGSGFTKGTGDNGWATGISIAESAMETFNGFKDGNWIEGGLGVVGLAADAASMAIDPFGTLMSSAASFLMEHVQPLKDMLDWLAGDPPVIESYSTTWNNVSTEMGKISQDYAAALSSGTEGWTGAAADAYRAAATQQGDALAGAASAAGSVGTVVGIMGMVVAFVREMVRDLIADLVAKLITWVLEAVFSLGFGTPVIVAQAITAISKWAARIAKLVQKLLDTIKKVSPMLKRLVEIFEKIMKVLGKIAGKATGLDVFGTKFDDPGFLKKLGRDGVDTPSGSPTGSSPSGRSNPDGPDTSPDSSPGGTSPSTGTPDATPTSASANPSNSPSPNGSQSPARDTSGPGDTTPSQTHSTPSSTTPSAHTPAGNSPTSSTHSPDSTPSGPSPSSSPTPHSPGTAPSHSPSSPGSTPASHSPGSTPSGHSPNSSPGSSPATHSPNSPGGTPSSHSPASAPTAHGPTGNPGPSPSGHSPTSPSSGPPRVDQTHSSATATPDAPHRTDQPQTAPPRDPSPSSAPQQPSPGGAPHASGQPGGAPSAGGPPRTGGNGWTGTSGHRGDTTSGVPQCRPHETPGGTSRPQSAPPPHAAGPPSARPQHAGPPQARPQHAGPPPVRPQAGPPHAGPSHQGPPRQGPSHQGPPRQGPPHQNAPHQPQPRGPQPGPPHDRGGVPPHRDPNGAPHHDGPSPDGHQPPHAPEPRPNIDEAHARHGETTPAGVSHHRGDSDMGDLPSRVPNDPRYFTADVHITPDGRAHIGNHSYSPEEYGDLLRRSGWDGKTPIRLISCDAGSNDFARRLAAHTDAPVLAPTKPAWTDSKGRVFTSDAEVDANGNRQPKIPPNGEWETHQPDGTRTKASEDGFVPGTHDKDKDGLDPTDARDRIRPADPISDSPDRNPSPQRQVEWTPPTQPNGHPLPEVPLTVDPNTRVADYSGREPLQPNSRMVVTDSNGNPRGVYYTDANRNITHIQTSVPNTGFGTNPLATPINPDAARPQPGVVYNVSTGQNFERTFVGGTAHEPRPSGPEPDATAPAPRDPSLPPAEPSNHPPQRFDEFDRGHTPAAVDWNPPGDPNAIPPGSYRTAEPVLNYDTGQSGPFSLSDTTPRDPHTRYDVYDPDGNWHGTFYTDADGKFSHVHTWSGNRDNGFNPELGTGRTWNEDLSAPRPNTTFAVGPRYLDNHGFDPREPRQLYRTDEHSDTAAASGRPHYPPANTRAADYFGNRRGFDENGRLQTEVGQIASGGNDRQGNHVYGDYDRTRHGNDSQFRFAGGHLISFEGGGPGERINHVPQWAHENSGWELAERPTSDSWRTMEREQAGLSEDPNVRVDRIDIWSERVTPDVRTPDVLHAQWTQTTISPATIRSEDRSFHNVPGPARNPAFSSAPPTPPTTP